MQGQLEVVFVALGDDHLQDIFNLEFANIPWLAVPYEDKEARRKLQEKFAVTCNVVPITYMIDPNGKILGDDLVYFQTFGCEGFPYTQDKLDQITNTDQTLIQNLYMKKLSLTDLFGDSLITYQGKQARKLVISISTINTFSCVYFISIFFFFFCRLVPLIILKVKLLGFISSNHRAMALNGLGNLRRYGS